MIIIDLRTNDNEILNKIDPINTIIFINENYGSFINKLYIYGYKVILYKNDNIFNNIDVNIVSSVKDLALLKENDKDGNLFNNYIKNYDIFENIFNNIENDKDSMSKSMQKEAVKISLSEKREKYKKEIKQASSSFVKTIKSSDHKKKKKKKI